MGENVSATVPTMVSLLVCDQVIDDKLTNKKSVIGLFNMVLVQRVPTQIHHMAVLASLTEITGRTPLELRLVRDTDNAVIFSTKGHVDAPNPLATVDLVFAMQGIRLADAGQYAFELMAREELLGRRRFQIVIGKRPGTGPARTPERPSDEPSEN